MGNEAEKDLILREIYYSPKIGYRSAEELYKLAHKENNSVSRDYTKNWLRDQEVYTKFKKWNNPKHYRKTFVRDLGEQVQIDLVILLKHAEENRGYSYILMGIEILSRFAFAVPLKRKDGKSTKDGLVTFFGKFLDKFGTTPKLIQFDEGGEFLNKNVKDFLEGHDVTYFTTSSTRKASIVERLNRTIKMKLLKLFEREKSHNWVDNLEDVIENYNTQVNRTIGVQPKSVTEENKHTIWLRLYGQKMNIGTPRFKVGDHVRVLHFNPKSRGKKFQAWYRENHPKRISKITGKPINEHMLEAKDKPPFSDEIFVVQEVLLGDPVMYKLYSPDAKVEILGKFYEEELSLYL